MAGISTLVRQDGLAEQSKAPVQTPATLSLAWVKIFLLQNIFSLDFSKFIYLQYLLYLVFKALCMQTLNNNIEQHATI